MNLDRQVNLVLLTSHDYLFFASRDYGATARPVDFVGNYALMYAINRRVPQVRRLISGSVPNYDADLAQMSVYATPAAPISAITFERTHTKMQHGEQSLSNQVIIGKDSIPFNVDLATTRITWNSTGESLLWAMETDQVNLPKLGAYYKHRPLMSFYFYTVGGPVPRVFRLGKKHAVVRVAVHPLDVTLKEGVFSPTCPVTIADLPESTRILQGSLLTVPPSPILTDAELEGPYLEGLDERGFIHRIPQPDSSLYTSSWSEEES